MSTVKRIESGLVSLLESDTNEYRIGPAWDNRTMQAFFSETGAVVVQLSRFEKLYPTLPDYRIEVVVRGRTSIEIDVDKSISDRIASLIGARLAELTPAEISAVIEERAVGWIQTNFARQSATDDSHQFEFTFNLFITELKFEE